MSEGIGFESIPRLDGIKPTMSKSLVSGPNYRDLGLLSTSY